jgi:hypothetical protein
VLDLVGVNGVRHVNEGVALKLARPSGGT